MRIMLTQAEHVFVIIWIIFKLSFRLPPRTGNDPPEIKQFVIDPKFTVEQAGI